MALEHEGNQEGISKDDFLDSLISGIDRLLEQDGGLNKFQGQFDNFCFMVESYGTELDKYHQLANNRFKNFADKNSEAQKLLKDCDKLLLQEQIKRFGEVELLYIGQCQTPPIDNPMWVLHGSMNDYIAKENCTYSAPMIYRPPLLELPTNPVLWFFSEMDKYLSNSDQTKPPNEEELLMCDFVRLAVIHDESCDYDKSIMIYKNKKYNGNFKRDDFAKDLWEAYENPKKDNFIRTHKRILQQALNHVKSNLVQPQTNINFKNNFIKATIKHLPYFGPYLFDLIYGVDGVKAQKKENESNAISEKQRARPKDKRESAETEQETRNKGNTYIITDSQVSFGDKAQHAGRDMNTTTPESEKEKGGWELVKKISLILGIIVPLIVIVGTYNKYIRKDKIDVSKVSNNLIFHFNAPVEILFHKNKDIQAGPQSGAIESPQIAPNREEYFKYLPNGLKRNNDGIEITNTSRELKRFFNFTKSNFTKAITGKQFKEMNSLLNQVLSKEPDFAYTWFYRGLFFSFASVNPEFKDKFSSIAESSFEKADDLFNVLLEKHPNDPFLLLYKGMNLTFLNRAEESVSYLKKALSLEPDILQKKHVFGIIACWNHIAPNYLQEWQTAMDKY